MGRNRVKGSATFAPGQHSSGCANSRAKDSANDNRESAMTTVMWANGELVDAQAPVVTGLDRGLLLGYGVFETLAVENGVPFALTRHLRRLETSARTIGLALPSQEDIRTGLDAALAQWNTSAGPTTRGRMRLTVTGGSGALGLPVDDPLPTILIAISPAGPPRKLGSAQGARGLLSPWPVNPHTGLAVAVARKPPFAPRRC